MDKLSRNFMYGYCSEMSKHGNFAKIESIMSNRIIEEMQKNAHTDNDMILSGRLAAVQEMAEETLQRLNVLMCQLSKITKHRTQPEGKEGICVLCSQRSALRSLGNVCEQCAQMNLFNQRENPKNG